MVTFEPSSASRKPILCVCLSLKGEEPGERSPSRRGCWKPSEDFARITHSEMSAAGDSDSRDKAQQSHFTDEIVAQGAEGVQCSERTWLGSRWLGFYSPGSASLCPQQRPHASQLQPLLLMPVWQAHGVPPGSDLVLVIPASACPTALASSSSCPVWCL